MESLANELMVPGEEVAPPTVTQLGGALRRADDVGEQDGGDGPVMLHLYTIPAPNVVREGPNLGAPNDLRSAADAEGDRQLQRVRGAASLGRAIPMGADFQLVTPALPSA
jgi:hypothetical protein